jgi:hypothetical protein
MFDADGNLLDDGLAGKEPTDVCLIKINNIFELETIID